MNENQQAAFIMSQVCCAMISMEGMKAANQQRLVRGESLAYSENDFSSLVSEFKVGWNDVIGYFKG